MLAENEQANSELKSGFHIPSKPQVITDIEEIISRKEFQLQELGNVIAKDMGLAADVLKIANSGSFGLSRTVSDINQAVCYLGIDQIKAIIAATKFRKAFTGSAINLERFWDEAIETATAMLFVANATGNKVTSDILYSIGLFHDCGIAAMSLKYKDYLDTLMKANDDSETELTDIEDERYGCNHAIIGYFIASSWHLPKPICQLILNHHDDEEVFNNADAECQYSFSVLQLAENLVKSSNHFEERIRFETHMNSYLDTVGLTSDQFEELRERYRDQQN